MSNDTNSANSAKQINTGLAGLLILVSLTAGFGGGWLGARSNSDAQNTATTKAQKQVVETESQLISGIAKNVGPSVVSVNVTSQGLQATVFGSQPYTQESAGTGIIISNDGYIITNRHVVPAGSSSVNVVLSDGTKIENVQVVGRTKDNDPLDVAFLKIKDTKGKKLVAAKLGDSSKTQVGERVVAIGNALGQFRNTVTSGIISGFGRNVQAGEQGSAAGSENLQDLFQTDAAINEGNSGGPLLNSSGEVVGINTAIAGNGAQNIGFAIPINDVQGIIKGVLKKGKFERPYIGIRYVTLTDDFANYYNLSIKRGAYIAPSVTSQSPIIADSPSAKAGLQEKDIITKVDGVNLDEAHTLTSQLGIRAVGDAVSLTINRDGKDQTIKIILEPQPGS